MFDASADLQKTLELIAIEREEDRSNYSDKSLSASIQERKRMGITWYPIVIKESYYGIGERLVVEIERPGDHSVSNMFQFGSSAALFSNYSNEGKDNPIVLGVVSLVRRNAIRLTLFVDELPEWIDTGKLGVNLMFDESSYKEMISALQQVSKAKNNRLAQLREIMLGNTPAEFLDLPSPIYPSLDPSQNKAVHSIACAKDIAVVHGPPGTGKTTTFVHAIQHTLLEEKQVLVCAASNSAVDLLALRLSAAGTRVVRLGNPVKINEALQALTIDHAISNHPEAKKIKEFKKRASEYKNMASKYKRNFGPAERQQRKAILDESRKLQAEAEKIEKYIIEDSISKAQVIATTLVGSANYMIKELQFPTVFIDEAGQAPEPACWIPILKATRVIFAGDHQQLPPTIKSKQAAKEGLSVTLFEKIIQRHKVATLLSVQYRMHEQIMAFSNVKFYENKLTADESVRTACLSDGIPFEFIDTAGCSFNEEAGERKESTLNHGEADLVITHCKILIEQGVLSSTTSIGFISPYKAQVVLLETKVQDDIILQALGKQLVINTVDGFQGEERTVIYISLVRSNDTGEIGFLNDLRRMNVAMTRAKKKLVVIGDSGTLARHPFYRDLIDYAERVNAYKSAWEYSA